MAQPVAERLAFLAANIRRHRERAGMTQAELADAASMELRYVQTLESGRANPTATTIIRVADALDISPGALFRPARLTPRSPGRPPKRR